MLIKKPQVHIVSKELTLPTGELVRAFFAIIETEGVREIKFLGVQPIVAGQTAEHAATPASEVMLLEAPVRAVVGDISIPEIAEAVSPYFTLDFLTSQLARAPSAR